MKKKATWRPHAYTSSASRGKQMLARGFCPHCEIRIESSFHGKDCPGWKEINSSSSLQKGQEPKTIKS